MTRTRQSVSHRSAREKRLKLTDIRTLVFGGIGVLLLLHWTVVLTSLHTAPAASGPGLWFDLDREQNLPTFISSLFFGLAGFWSLRLVSRAAHWVHKVGWAGLALLFVYFALDEYYIIHEQLAEPLRKVLDIQAGSPFFHAWVIPGIAVVALLGLGILLLKHFRKLAVFIEPVIIVFVLAGGVILLEMLGTYAYDHTALYRLVVIPMEEIFELCLAATLWLRLRHRYLKGKA